MQRILCLDGEEDEATGGIDFLPGRKIIVDTIGGKEYEMTAANRAALEAATRVRDGESARLGKWFSFGNFATL